MHHAEPALDQWLWMRPTPDLAGYRTPIPGLYLCGPGDASRRMDAGRVRVPCGAPGHEGSTRLKNRVKKACVKLI
jgi:hypothetical protein